MIAIFIILLFLGAISVALLHGWLGKMLILNLPIGRGWNGIDIASYVIIPLDLAIFLVLICVPYIRWFGLGSLLYFMVSYSAVIGQALHKRKHEAYSKPS